MTPAELNAINAAVQDSLDEAVLPLAEAYQKLLKGAGRRMARRVRKYSALVAAGGPSIVPPDEDEVIPEIRDQVKRLTEKERASLVKVMVSAYEAQGIAWDVHGLFTEELLEKVGAHAAFAADQELREIYRGVITQAAEQGFSIPRTATAITEAVDGTAAYRATALARTDLIGLANGASQHAATQAFSDRDDVTKIWLATNDDRTRETHVDADGQEVPLNEYFDVGGSSLMYPGDPDGPDEEVINCRCTLIYGAGGGGGDGGDVDEIAMEGDWSGNMARRDVVHETSQALSARYDTSFERVLVREAEEFGQLAGKSNDTIYVSPRYLDDAFMEKHLREWREVSLMDKPEDIITHEFGHILDGELLRRSPDAYARWNAHLAEELPFPGPGGGTLPRIEQGLLSPSVYGLENRYEWFAEAFLDWWKHGSNVTNESSRLVGELLRELERAPSMTASVRPSAYPADMDTTQAHTAAVVITVEDDAAQAAADERERTPWEGIMAIAGSPTSDRRYLFPGEISHRDLPLPLAPSHEAQHETETVGRIETIEHIPIGEFAKPGWTLPDDLPAHAEVIWATGSFDGSPEAEDALRQLENGVGVSLDLPTTRQAILSDETYEEIPFDQLPEDVVMAIAFGGTAPEGYLRGIAGKIGGLSLASIAAFEETTIRLVDDHALVASGFAIRERAPDPFLESLTAEMRKPLTLLASAAPIEPPRPWFFMDEPDEPTPLTILPDGQWYAHMALWHTCHAGRANGAYSSCMYAPHSPSGYKQFHLGSVLCDDGSEVAVGRFTIGTGHAPLHLNAAAARAHYDNTGTVVALGRAVDGIFGIWVCGAIKSDATPEQIRDFRLCPPSGDWRAVDGMLEMQAALAVNVPGYVVPRSQLALAASADSLAIGALVLGAPSAEDYMEALRADYDLQVAEDVDMLVELGVGEFCGTELATLTRVDFRNYSDATRRRLARTGEAMADGSFPLVNCTDVALARAALERHSGPHALAAHIRKRSEILGCL